MRERTSPAATSGSDLDDVPVAGEVSTPMTSLEGLSAVYPSRGAAEELTRRVLRVLETGSYSAGDRFMTDDELVAATGLSRSTVRRALSSLKKSGRLRRRSGLGTFVGRAGSAGSMDWPADQGVTAHGVPGAVSWEGGGAGTSASHRLGVIAFNPRVPAYDWLTPSLMQGVHEAARARGTRVELLPGLSGSLAASMAALVRDAPDVLACLSNDPDDALLMRAAADRGMRCVVIGTLFPELTVPRICEDNRGGMDLAVRKLHALGHERIGLVMRRWVGAWVFKRHEQWAESLRALGLDHDEQLMHWLPSQDQDVLASAAIDRVQRWIERARPTAIVCGHYLPAMHLGHLQRSGRLRVPDDVSVVVIDRHPDLFRLLGVEPSTINLPLMEMGRALVDLSENWCEGVPPPSLTQLSMTWQPGGSTRPRVGP